MSSSFTITESSSFTVTHAKHIAAKVATDLKRIQRFYGSPSDLNIDRFEREVVELLKRGFLSKVTYGFQDNGNWVEPTLVYTASDMALSNNDDPGRVRPGRDVSGLTFYSFLEYSPAWFQLSEAEQSEFKRGLPFNRTSGSSPGISGYLENDLGYTSGGKSLSRASVRSLI